ncbi:iron ABC transporter permease, partial [Streptosporangium sp. NPDC048865]|uniref:FecCD family ABC transporter permease n=1 Tax=Streptosporangium sp. NPDC048865 TaxID=3155766 RepID=UPI00341E7182
GDRPRRPAGAGRTLVFALAGTALLVLAGFCSLTVGATGMPLERVVGALWSATGSGDRGLVVGVRLPRVVLAALVGASLAVAGLLAQSLTRNPLASAQTFGINAGAAVAIVATTIALGAGGAAGTAAAFAGAGAVGAVMWALSATTAIGTVGLALAGMSLQILLSALVQAILVMNNATQDIVFWLAGSVTGAQWPDVTLLLPFTLAGCVIAGLAHRRFGLLALDSATGEALGQNTRRVAGGAALLVVTLAGASVAVAGPIGFVGLIVPHIARTLVGGDFGRRLVLCVVGGALLLVVADLLARLVAFPGETPAGVVTAVVGAPAFLFLALRSKTR